jgi:NAD(P)-dependent dehydrogenase (short-subunit alcohol dehydrogenase family)
MKRADWDLVLAINLTGPFLLTQALLRPMLKNRWGRIVNMASVVGRAGQAGQVNYAASKAGLIGLDALLAREVASRGITVNAVAPGYIETPMTAVLDEKQSAAMMARFRWAGPEPTQDIAQAVVPGLGCGSLHHRPRARRERRHVHGRLIPTLLRISDSSMFCARQPITVWEGTHGTL